MSHTQRKPWNKHLQPAAKTVSMARPKITVKCWHGVISSPKHKMYRDCWLVSVHFVNTQPCWCPPRNYTSVTWRYNRTDIELIKLIFFASIKIQKKKVRSLKPLIAIITNTLANKLSCSQIVLSLHKQIVKYFKTVIIFLYPSSIGNKKNYCV